MKKRIMYVVFATIAAAVAVAGYYDHSQTKGLTQLQIANIESLSKPKPDVVIEYDKACSEGSGVCVTGPQSVHKATPRND